MFKDPIKNPKWFIKKIEIKKSLIHGCGVFASEVILKHEMFESCPVVLFHHDILNNYSQFHGVSHILDDYVFKWKNGNLAVALGYGSVYNHSNDQANAVFRAQVDDPRIEFTAKRDIQPGEEIFTHYRHGKCELDFDDSGSKFEAGQLSFSPKPLSSTMMGIDPDPWGKK